MVYDYWLSTPLFTCWIRVDDELTEDGIIVHSAPLLRKWRGQTWKALYVWCRRKWGYGVRYCNLDEVRL